MEQMEKLSREREREISKILLKDDLYFDKMLFCYNKPYTHTMFAHGWLELWFLIYIETG